MVKKVLYSVIGVAVLGFVFLFILGSNLPKPKVAQNSVATSTPVAVTTPPKQVTAFDKQKATAVLSASIKYYTQLFATGKLLLGTTQYADTNTALRAFDDPNSAAVKFGAFRTDTCLKNDPGANIMSAYRAVSDLYYSAGISSIDDLDNWSYDLNTAASDICLWAGDAVSWQIKEISTAKLQADQQKVDADFVAVQADMRAISK